MRRSTCPFASTTCSPSSPRRKTPQRITPPELRFEIVTQLPDRDEALHAAEYRRVSWYPLSLATDIAAPDPPRGFIDVQISGPYAVWEHMRVFVPTEAGTLIDDRVRYRLPLSPLGDTAYPLVRRQLARIFAFRQDAVREALLGASGG